MQNILTTVNAIGPVFLIILLGILLRRLGLLDDTFIRKSTALVFKVSLPALIFLEIATTDFTRLFDGRIVLLGIGGTLLMFFLSLGLSRLIPQPASQGPFIQGTFRGNIAIIGFAVILNLLGQEGLTRAAILLSFLLPLFNILSVIALTVPLHRHTDGGGAAVIARNILTNPLILSVLAALPFSLTGLAFPPLVCSSLDYLARISLPLALLGIGGSLSFASFFRHAGTALTAAIFKLLLFPAGITLAAYLWGVRGTSLGVVWIFFSCPAAISTFVMAQAMDNDSDLAASIVVTTTLASLITMGAGIYFLISFNFIPPNP